MNSFPYWVSYNKAYALWYWQGYLVIGKFQDIGHFKLEINSYGHGYIAPHLARTWSYYYNGKIITNTDDIILSPMSNNFKPNCSSLIGKSYFYPEFNIHECHWKGEKCDSNCLKMKPEPFCENLSGNCGGSIGYIYNLVNEFNDPRFVFRHTHCIIQNPMSVHIGLYH